ncbi:hypothetical protein TNCV_3173811 [Trichonephila clavipes]|nr:hypothetical protein TNCV_3173811 [Trichonephila clavipes]
MAVHLFVLSNVLTGIHLYGISVSFLRRRNIKECISNVKMTGQFIDPPCGLRGVARAYGGWDQGRECRVPTRDTRQSEIIGGMKEVRPQGLTESVWKVTEIIRRSANCDRELTFSLAKRCGEVIKMYHNILVIIF